MDRKELRKLIKEIIIDEKKGSFFDEWKGGKREAQIIYNFYASADLLATNLDAFMDDFRTGQFNDAKASASHVLDEIKSLKKDITKVEKALWGFKK